jgi:hypothetical protein
VITQTDLAEYVGISDTIDLALVQDAAEAAVAAVQAFAGREFVVPTAATARVFRPANGLLCYVDDIASTTGLVVRTDEDDDGVYEVTWAAAEFELRPLNGRHTFGVGPWTHLAATETRYFPLNVRASVQITARWGWPAIPEQVRRAALQVGAELFKRKDAPFGVAGFGEFGPIRLSADSMRSVTSLLAPFMSHRTIGIA